MKITIEWSPGEERDAKIIRTFVCALIPGAEDTVDIRPAWRRYYISTDPTPARSAGKT